MHAQCICLIYFNEIAHTMHAYLNNSIRCLNIHKSQARFMQQVYLHKLSISNPLRGEYV